MRRGAALRPRAWTDARGPTARASCTATSARRTSSLTFDGGRQAHRLRHRQGARPRRTETTHGRHQGQVRLHVARADPRHDHRPALATSSRSASCCGRCCTGANLYREKSELLTMEAILRKPVPMPRELRGDMPPDLEAIIMKALAKRAVDRFQTGYEMHQALEGYLNRSNWGVGTPHLSEFMKKLFPDEYKEIRDLLNQERLKAEAENRSDTAAAKKAQSEEAFVAWEPYQDEASGMGNLPMAPSGRPNSAPVLQTVRPATAAASPAPARAAAGP
ncbi:MAG: hypothetical protein M0C28_41085 [Candidatus Moduliflexus flocculans]|nr:hypothetical protein [Candidatus Moduliflexus flocculans]